VKNTHKNVYVGSYTFPTDALKLNLINEIKKLNILVKNQCDMLHGMALNSASIICCTVSPDTLVPYSLSNRKTMLPDYLEGANLQ
jgi:hypothetical protein